MSLNKEITTCPSTKGLSDYYGVSHRCNYKSDKQDVCKTCWKVAKIHYDKERSELYGI